MKKPELRGEKRNSGFCFGFRGSLQSHPKPALSSCRNINNLPSPVQVIFSEIMAGTNLYLIRNNNLTWAKYSGVVDVFLSTKETPYASVAGVASTNVVTITGATLVDGMVVVFPSLTGGSGITASTPYYTVNSSGSTCKLAQTPGGIVVGLGTDITDGTAIVSTDAMRAWSSEFRDIFNYSASMYAFNEVGANLFTVGNLTSDGVSLVPGELALNNGGSTTFSLGPFLIPDGVTASVSDEVNHQPLRQTLLQKTFWLFDMGSSAQPRYLPAEYLEGDIIATSPPQIP